MNEIGYSEEFRDLLLRHAVLKERVANEIEMYMHYVNNVGPNIKAKYMMLVGCLECTVRRLEVDVNRWKRRFALRQQYLNRGDKPDMVAIEAQLDREFARYVAEIAAYVKELEESKLRWDAEKMSDKEAAAIRYDYLKAVKRLHPDINENLSESAKSLWNQIQQAYAENDWRQLKFLVGLVDDVMSENAAVAASDGGLEEMRAACARLEAEAGDVAKNIADLKSKKPFTYEDLIDDSEALAQRQAWLNGRIKELESAIARYERIWNNGQ